MEFIESFLPELELVLSANPAVSSKIMLMRIDDKMEDLADYYRNHQLSEFNPEAGRKAIIAINQESNWLAEVKSCALFADHVICEDPFQNCRRVYGTFSNNDLWQWGQDNLSREALIQFRRVMEMVWEVMPLIRAGILTFFPINDPLYLGQRAFTADDIETEFGELLRNDLEIVDSPIYRGFTVRIPMIDYEHLVEVDRDAWWGDLSPHEMAVRTCLKWFATNSITVHFGLYCAEVASGTFWSSSFLHWKLCRIELESIPPATKSYSFIHEFTRPQLELISSRNLISVRNEESAFEKFRMDMAKIPSFIRSDVDSSDFDAEIQQWFEGVYKPNIAMIQETMRRNSLLKNLPWVAAASGFAYAASAISASPVPGAIFGTLASLLGFGPQLTEEIDKRTRIRREPAYVFWKLGRIADGP